MTCMPDSWLVLPLSGSLAATVAEFPSWTFPPHICFKSRIIPTSWSQFKCTSLNWESRDARFSKYLVALGFGAAEVHCLVSRGQIAFLNSFRFISYLFSRWFTPPPLCCSAWEPLAFHPVATDANRTLAGCPTQTIANSSRFPLSSDYWRSLDPAHRPFSCPNAWLL